MRVGCTLDLEVLTRPPRLDRLVPVTTWSREIVGELAASQHGVITREQLRALGIAQPTIESRIRNGEWVRIGHGLFTASGAPRSSMMRVQAAVLSRRRAIISGRAAAWLHRFEGVALPSPIEITAPHTANARSTVARVHRSHHFFAIGTSKVEGVTTADRCETIFRLADALGPRRLARFIDDELIATPETADRIGDIYLRHQGERMRGMATLRPLILERIDGAYVPTESELEALADTVLATLESPEILRQAPLPWAPTAGRVDRLIPDWRLIIELDGRTWHARTEAFESDRQRDNAAASHGYRTLRLTWNMLRKEPHRCRQLVIDAGRVAPL